VAAPKAAPPADEAAMIALREWAVSRWRDEVEHRPLVNKNRRPLDDAWRQVMRYAGLDPDEAVGPAHDVLVQAAPAPVAPQPCEWRLTDLDAGIWSAACDPDVAYCFSEGGPIENGHKHCHACGRPLVVKDVDSDHGIKGAE
jgi:hypothetical protein